MLDYWMRNNDTEFNYSEFKIKEVIEDPGSAILFGGYPPWLLYFAASCCMLFMLIGIPGNLITVAALFRTKKLRNATAVFIMNLSVSDLMFCCFNLPLATSTFWHSAWLHGPLLCRLFPLLRYGLVAVSLFTVLAITINRYVMIGHPRLYPKLYKSKYLTLMVLATWTSGFGALIATWFERWGRFGLDPEIGSCSILPDVNGRSPKEFLFILAFLAPCVAIVVCYARIFYIVRNTAIKSRRRDKAAIDLVKASLDVNIKCTKTFEDSAIGSSFGPTCTTGNGDSSLKSSEKNYKLNSSNQKYSETLSISKISDQESAQFSCSSLKNIEESPILNLNNHFRARRFTVPELRIQYQNSISINEGKSITPIDIENIQFIDSGQNYDDITHYTTIIDNSKNVEKNFSKNEILKSKIAFGQNSKSDSNFLTREIFDKDIDKNCEINLKFSNVHNNLRKPKNVNQHSSENLLSPRVKKYDDISEDFTSSRSESPSLERRSERKVSIFRRESRFRSIRDNVVVDVEKLSTKDKKLLKMILVIFISFLVCYLPITITKTFKDVIDWRGFNIVGYILIYLTTCINPVIYVIMSSEYRSAYKNVLLCRNENSSSQSGKNSHKKKKNFRNK
ncbi:G-protein coupled receptor moody-like [Leptopilina boulardi]|uniref:G-protein coupled receptor moody-like n=1 Tax=Leptopilina boulardi TaxID=63433 RepID=UPI0021F68257|nr:G-protein coupled receptor moody-like [Leptopilina boulardi]XP_051174013.1 G-protein coupled receptor moody-like [Leptopilina boulardi]